MPIRRYEPGQRFDKHYDDSIDMGGGLSTAYTLLVYLSGHDTGMQGGETIFYSHGKHSSVGTKLSCVAWKSPCEHVDCSIDRG